MRFENFPKKLAPSPDLVYDPKTEIRSLLSIRCTGEEVCNTVVLVTIVQWVERVIRRFKVSEVSFQFCKVHFIKKMNVEHRTPNIE